MTEHDALAESAAAKGQKLAQEINSAVTAHHRMLRAWREHRDLMFTHMDPQEVPLMFSLGWNTRESELNDLKAQIGGLEALVQFWKEKANERD